MPKLPVVTGEEAIKALKNANFQTVRQKGSHVRLKRQDGRLSPFLYIQVRT